MSSETSDSLKHPSGDKSCDEPSAKKVRLADETNQAKNESTEGASGILKQNQVPSKASTNNNNNTKADGDDDKVFLDPPYDMDPNVTKALVSVEAIQLELFKLNEKASEEILKVEQKFNQLRRPYFEKRNESLKDIPNFWGTTLSNHHVIAPLLESDHDEGCLAYLTTFDVEEYEDIKSGYRIKFHFSENPYITNEVIIKSFTILTSEDVRSSSTPIEYKNTEQGKALKQIVERSIANSSNARYPPGTQTQSSFFAWISTSCESQGTDEVAEILKDQIWPNPLEFFFATGDDEYDEGATDDDSDDDEDDDDDIDEDGAFMSEDIGEEIASEEEASLDGEEDQADENDLDDIDGENDEDDDIEEES